MEKLINKLNSGDPSEVKDGETILLRATVDGTGENLFLTFGSIVVKKRGVAGNFNRTRKRDYIPGLRRANIPVTYGELVENMNIDIYDIESQIDDKGREYYELNILHPHGYDQDDNTIKKMCVEVLETTAPSKEEAENWKHKAKKLNGEYFKHKGKLIFSNTEIVWDKPNHEFLKHDLPEYLIINEPITLKEPDLMEDTELNGSFLD